MSIVDEVLHRLADEKVFYVCANCGRTSTHIEDLIQHSIDAGYGHQAMKTITYKNGRVAGGIIKGEVSDVRII